MDLLSNLNYGEINIVDLLAESVVNVPVALHAGGGEACVRADAAHLLGLVVAAVVRLSASQQGEQTCTIMVIYEERINLPLFWPSQLEYT